MFKSIPVKNIAPFLPHDAAGLPANSDLQIMQAFDPLPGLADWPAPEFLTSVPIEAEPAYETGAFHLTSALAGEQIETQTETHIAAHLALNVDATMPGEAALAALSGNNETRLLPDVQSPREVCVLPPDHKLTGTVKDKEPPPAAVKHFAISEAAGAITWDNEPFLFVLDNEPVQTGEREERLMQAQDDGCSDCGVLFLSPWASEGIDNCAFTASCSQDKAVNACLAIDFTFATP